MNDESEDNKGKDDKKPIVIRNSTDLQRLKLQKLMKNPDKPIIIPEKPKERGVPSVPDFVRNVMGSSAGAGSGEFHVYRHLRRKEYARQKYMKEKAEREKQDDDYHHKLEENKIRAEERTAKKRLKRLKKKQKQKKNAKKQQQNKLSDKVSSEDSESSSTEEESSITDSTTESCSEKICDIESKRDKNELTENQHSIQDENYSGISTSASEVLETVNVNITGLENESK